MATIPQVGYLGWLSELTKGTEYSVLLLDPAGGGRSHALTSVVDSAEAWVQQSAEDVRKVLGYWRGGDQCGSDAERVLVVGHSVGAAIAQGRAAMCEHPSEEEIGLLEVVVWAVV